MSIRSVQTNGKKKCSNKKCQRKLLKKDFNNKCAKKQFTPSEKTPQPKQHYRTKDRSIKHSSHHMELLLCFFVAARQKLLSN